MVFIHDDSNFAFFSGDYFNMPARMTLSYYTYGYSRIDQ